MNRKAFYDALRPTLGAFTEPNVAGFELVLDEARRRGTPLNDLAYILATAWWETAKTMQPVREGFWLSEDWRERNLRYYPFYGRGFVQLTWEENYRKASQLYGVDLVKDPDRAMETSLAVRILFNGMNDGWFTGRDLDDYIDDIDEDDDEDLREFANARRIVNGTDKQIAIGTLALDFEAALKAAGYGAPLISIPKPEEAPIPAPIGHNGGPALDPMPARRALHPSIRSASPMAAPNGERRRRDLGSRCLDRLYPAGVHDAGNAVGRDGHRDGRGQLGRDLPGAGDAK